MSKFMVSAGLVLGSLIGISGAVPGETSATEATASALRASSQNGYNSGYNGPFATANQARQFAAKNKPYNTGIQFQCITMGVFTNDPPAPNGAGWYLRY